MLSPGMFLFSLYTMLQSSENHMPGMHWEKENRNKYYQFDTLY